MDGSHQGKRSHGANFRIFFGLIIGTIIGVAFNFYGRGPTGQWLLANIVDPIGQLFLRGLFLAVVPLVFSSLSLGVAGLGTISHLGRMGGRLTAFYLCTVILAILIGQLLVTMLQPGAGISADYVLSAKAGYASQVASLMEKSATAKESLWPGIITSIVPKNAFSALAAGDMLAIIFVSILFGIALLKMGNEKNNTTLSVLQTVNDASIMLVGWVMKLAPVAVAALMALAVARFGFEILSSVLKYVGVVILGLVIHFCVVYLSISKWLLRISPGDFVKRAFPALATAFTTSSSNATIPTTMHTLEQRFGVPPNITNFVVPLGATVNMDGTALFEAVSALFVAQVFGVELGLAQQVTLVVLVLLTAVGVAGIPGGSIPLLMSVMATLGIPPEGIALVLGVDRLLDMCRTLINVAGDLLGALYLARAERVPLIESI